MQRHFDQELGALKDKLLTMASHSESALVNAVKSLLERDDHLAQEVERQDSVIDQFELELDELCIDLLALRSPVASDLRLIAVAMKITQNLERVGDEATKIARRALALNREAPLAISPDFLRMSGMANDMLRDALDAFVHGNTQKARDLIPRDKAVDALNKQVHRELNDLMLADPGNINRALNLMVVSKSLERVADHATNIAEEVVYLCEARDIRHADKSERAV